MDSYVLHEITPLMETDALYIADRHKGEFSYPVHNHDVYELNFVENAAGVRRIVGDSTEVIGDYDLVLSPILHSSMLGSSINVVVMIYVKSQYNLISVQA